MERYFVAFPESRMAAALVEFVQHEDPTGDFAVRLEVGGRTLAARNRATTDWRSRANSFTAQSAQFPLAVTATLADPPAFFAIQRRRQWLFSALLLTAAGTCVAACFSARRAFLRQLRLNEMKSNFVSSVSHELRAPIASVRLMAESLEREKVHEPQKQKEYFGFIVQECRRLSSLIENVLDFSRIEQGRKQYDLEPTDLGALVNQTVALMQSYAAEKGVNLVLGTSNIQHSTFNIELNVDGKAIQQALVNLIDNAIKHSPKGEAVTVGIEVRSAKCEVRSNQKSDAGNQKPAGTALSLQPPTLNLFVEDHGDGIPPEEHEKIFERFYRRGSELRRETQGVGIGLSIVKHIVEAHGGKVRVRSAVGQGSRFTIELPMQ
jgi:signal transduction histidine kinase